MTGCPGVTTVTCSCYTLVTRCPGSDDWISMGDYCYLFSDPDTQGQKTWDEAEKWCNLHEGYLASVGSQQEQDFLNNLVRTTVNLNYSKPIKIKARVLFDLFRTQ